MTSPQGIPPLIAAPSAAHLHVISSLNPETGGPVEALRQLSTAWRRSGQSIEIATIDPPDAGWDRHFVCPVHNLGPGAFGKYSYSAKLTPWLRSNAWRFRAVVVHGLWQFHGLAAWQALRSGGTPYFVFTHGMLDPWFRREYPLKHCKKLLYWPWAEYRVLRDARAVLFTCEEERLLARQSFSRYRANEAVVACGTPGPEGSPDALRESFLDRFPALRGKRLLLFMGRIHPKKGCDLLIEALADVNRQSRSPLHLIMAGPDQVGWQQALHARARQLGVSGITWTGMLRGDVKWGAFYAAEAFVLPSHQENFGIAVAEALSCQLPVLISDKVNIWRELVADHAAIVAADTLQGTRQLLHTWTGLSQLERKRMASNAEQCFRQRFQIDAAATNIIDSINSLVTSAAP